MFFFTITEFMGWKLNRPNKNSHKSFIDSGTGLEIMQHGALIDPKGKAPLSVACFMAGTGISVFTAVTAEPVQLLGFTCQVHMNRNIAGTRGARAPWWVITIAGSLAGMLLSPCTNMLVHQLLKRWGDWLVEMFWIPDWVVQLAWWQSNYVIYM